MSMELKILGGDLTTEGMKKHMTELSLDGWRLCAVIKCPLTWRSWVTYWQREVAP